LTGWTLIGIFVGYRAATSDNDNSGIAFIIGGVACLVAAIAALVYVLGQV